MDLSSAAAAMMQTRMNAELMASTTCSGKGRAEKNAEKRAKQAEAAFRASKGYVPNAFWTRLRSRVGGPSHHS